MRTTSIVTLAAASAWLISGCSGGAALPGSGGTDTTIADVAGQTVPDATNGAAALLCVHFASNPMCHPLPANPNVSGSSDSWSAIELAPGKSSFGSIQVSNAANPYLDSYDDSYPLENEPLGSATIKQTVSCDNVSYSYSICSTTGMNGKVVHIPANMVPEGSSDHHFSYDDHVDNGEVDFWDTNGPPYASDGGTLHVGGAGFCAWGGTGTSCSGSTATNIDTALAGGIDAALTKAAESDSVHGHLPYALGATAMCADISANFDYPATGSDGTNTNSTPACAGHLGAGERPPEGVRWFLAMHDADINATDNVPFVKVLLRTMDEDHFGGTITDSDWSGTSAGLQLLFHRGNYAFAAAEEGIYYGTDVGIPVTSNGINLATAVKFCTNGTC
jgi:hypothetical protein